MKGNSETRWKNPTTCRVVSRKNRLKMGGGNRHGTLLLATPRSDQLTNTYESSKRANGGDRTQWHLGSRGGDGEWPFKLHWKQLLISKYQKAFRITDGLNFNQHQVWDSHESHSQKWNKNQEHKPKANLKPMASPGAERGGSTDSERTPIYTAPLIYLQHKIRTIK